MQLPVWDPPFAWGTNAQNQVRIRAQILQTQRAPRLLDLGSGPTRGSISFLHLRITNYQLRLTNYLSLIQFLTFNYPLHLSDFHHNDRTNYFRTWFVDKRSLWVVKETIIPQLCRDLKQDGECWKFEIGARDFLPYFQESWKLTSFEVCESWATSAYRHMAPELILEPRAMLKAFEILSL